VLEVRPERVPDPNTTVCNSNLATAIKKRLAGVHGPSTPDHVDDRPPASQQSHRNSAKKARANFTNFVDLKSTDAFQALNWPAET
jgi:hypothetical protein